jgi:hypothetical protein
MLRINHINPVLRATGVIGVVAAMVTGVTFAALNSQATLTSNTVSTATVGLEVGKTVADLGTTAPGFDVNGLVPGTGVDQDFYLRNTGDTPLDISAHVPTLPAAPEGGYGFTGWDNLTVKLTGEACAEVVTTNLQELNAGEVQLPCNPLAEGGEANTSHKYTAHFDINPSAVTGNHAGVDDFDLVFTGMAATEAPAPETP